ncbi:MAG: S41 family peptidase [Planctomycetota bacterium]
MLRRLLLPLLLLTPLAHAKEELLWIRYPALSPDGSQVCFSYGGDLWLVPSAGGDAVPLTTHVAYERSPVWSRDGKQIAYATDRHGNFDVYVRTIADGAERRLTWHSGWDVPSDFSPDGSEVLFSSARAGDAKSHPASWRGGKLWSVPVAGGRPRLVLPTPALHARYDEKGARIVYENQPGRENEWRKHHTSSVTRDIWIYDVESGKHTRVTDSKHEDRDPHFDGDAVVHLCAADGTFNVKGRTKFRDHPVRFLSRARNGTLCFAWHGSLYTLAKGAEPQRVVVRGHVGPRSNARRTETMRKGATQFAVSPNEKEIAFIVRGELFVASVEHGTTRRLTHTSTQERSPSWAPDGEAIYFAGEREGSWNLYRVRLARPEDKYFFRATRVVEEPVLVEEDESFQPLVSPDGKRVAYLHNRDEIRVLELASKNAWTVVPAARNYSYADGDIAFAWSPDSKWLAFNMAGSGRWIESLGVADAGGEKVIDMTRSGYYEARPRWSPDGRGLLFSSNRLGRRSHGSWGSDADVFVVDLTDAAHERARWSVEEYELRTGKKDKEKKKDEAKTDKAPPKVDIEFEDRERRTRRLSLHSARLFAFDISPDGEKLVKIARVGNQTGLWLTHWRKGETKRIAKLDGNGGDVRFAKDGKSVFVRSGGGTLHHIELKGDAKRIGFKAEMEIDAPAERAYIFEHAWRQVKRKFYRADLHGAPWEKLRKDYEPLLAHVHTNHDFAELLSELLGELNASHTGCYHRIPQEGTDQTASLGVLYDPRDRGEGLKMVEVLPGGPAARAGIESGSVLLRVGDTKLDASVNLSALLDRQAGKRLLLAVRKPDGSTAEVVVEPVSLRDESELLYRRWVEQRRKLTDELSEGRIGYVHVRGMGDRSFRRLYQDAIGRYGNRAALIVDTRNNGGGWLHDDLVKFLGGRKYAIFHPRGKKRGAFGTEPFDRWADPVAVIVNEQNYSDAHIFPYAFQKLGLGPVVGAKVAGTGTAVWWERQIDPTLVFGIPQVGIVEPGGDYVENQDFVPDHIVPHGPESVARGDDPQLKKAIEVLLEKLG